MTIRLSNRFRWWAALVAGVSGVIGWGIWDQPDLFAAPLYEPMLSMLPLTAWQWLWATVSALMVCAMVSRRAQVWVAGSVMAIAVAAMWLAGISWAHWVQGARVSPLGWALWAYFVFTQAFVLTARSQYEGRVR